MSEENRNEFENTNDEKTVNTQPTEETVTMEHNNIPEEKENNSTVLQENNNDSFSQPTSKPTSYNTGYYSSANTNNQTNSMYSYPNYSYNNPYNRYEQQEPTPKPKKEKKKKNTGTVILCVALSLVCGFVGAFGGMFIHNEFFADKTTGTDGNNSTGNTVIYESVDKELDADIKEAGTVAAVAKTALPSVVEITTEAVVNNSFYGQYVTSGAGSGVIISADGYIVTNNHVVSGSSNIKVRLSNNEEYTAKLIGTDAQTDIAVIKIEAEKLTPAVYGDSSKLIIGELTVAIGNPLGTLGGTVTDGIISALDREITVDGENMVLLQTNVAVNPGNSGGGLFNSNGALIGIVNAKSTGSDVEGLGFAIPINTAKPIIEDIIKNGHVTGRPSFGITVVEVTAENQLYMFRMYGLRDYGVYIQKALNEGFKAADRIIAVDGNSISNSAGLKAILNNYKVGDKVTVTVERNSKIVDVEVTLIDSTENTLSTTD